MKGRAVVLAVVVLGAVPAVAGAHKPATKSQKSAMIYHAGSHYDHLSAKQVDEPKSYPLDCAEADIATVVSGSNWGAWSFNPKAIHKHGCSKWASNGWVIEHKINAKWYVLAEGSELPAHIKGVPHNIAVDLTNGLD